MASDQSGPRSRGIATGLIQTNNINRNPRYSYMETPVEMQRPVFQQFSSPTNSTIDESPVSPREGIPNVIQDIIHSPFLVENSVVRAGSPYNVQPLQEVHPAHFAPYMEDPAAQHTEAHHSAQEPQSPGPIPIKTHDVQGSSTATPVRTAPQEQRKLTATVISPDSDGVYKPPVYNPLSPTGPNVTHGEHLPGQVSHPNAAVQPEWKHGFCEMDTLCCMGCVCPCMIYGKTQYRLSRKAKKLDPTDMLGYDACNGSCGLMAVACGFQCEHSPSMEGSLRADSCRGFCIDPAYKNTQVVQYQR